MMAPMNAGRWRLYGVLVLTLAAAGWLALQDTQDAADDLLARPADVRANPAAPAPRRAPAAAVVTATGASSTQTGLPAQLGSIARVPLAAEGADFAAPLSFRPPPPPPGPAPKPMAPALPFRYIGGIDDGGNRSALLMEGNRLHIVRRGDTLDGRYRIEQIGDASIDFTFLPLKQRQSLPISRS